MLESRRYNITLKQRKQKQKIRTCNWPVNKERLINLVRDPLNISKRHPSDCEKICTAPHYLSERHREQETGFYTSKTPDDAKKPPKELVRKLPLNTEIKCSLVC